MADNQVARWAGGSPLGVLARLVLLSILVGVILSALGLDPFDIVRSIERLVRSLWNTPDIWLRREFVLQPDDWRGAKLRIHHDEDAEVYFNGVLAARLRSFVTGYLETNLTTAALAALGPGTNTIAVHCRQTSGGQFIDVGIVALPLVPDDPEGK